ncbi:MAG: nucleotidyltransferase domain-containing protein [Ignavibacteriae bacterium]|nr:nucleotidyltransferase domain-containing protein [Ignavibacteriota bacterium]
MDKKFESVINDIQNTFKKKYKEFKGIYLFGSRINGNYNEYSDYDFVVVFDRKIDWRFRYEVRDFIYDIELKNDLLLDAKIYNINDILEPITPFRNTIKEQGIFYAR